ncbi:ScbR family autoregulator-binding transcription factor [Streptomyces sp. P6-2-1]|uniref:ScbR family autoregulator-binding transcription factor n=1 Tax=unclassified Streptomyces TaxID=2593676 RepID=UPI003D3673D2
MAKQERAGRTREKLVTAAAGQFAAHGYVKATLGDVSREAGVTKGALFFHFATKDDLAAAVQARGRDLLEIMVEELACERGASLPVLVEATHRLSRMLRDDPFVRAGVRITRERVTGCPSPLDFYPVWLERLWEVLEDARAHDELSPAVPDASARALVTAAVAGVEILAWMGVPAEEGEEWLRHLWGLLLPLVAAPRGFGDSPGVPGLPSADAL